MLSASAPVCYALVLEAIKGNNAIIESGKSMPISAYMLRTLECCLVLRICQQNSSAKPGQRHFPSQKNSGHPLEQNIVVSYERSSPDFRDA